MAHIELKMRYNVSIHAPREGCDRAGYSPADYMSSFNSRTPGGVRLQAFGCDKIFSEFQFTHPGRGATLEGLPSRSLLHVSIHAPREGCDILQFKQARQKKGFNSRTPGGVRHPRPHVALCTLRVSIHAPREGCDCESLHFVARVYVSIHAPREGCDVIV